MRNSIIFTVAILGLSVNGQETTPTPSPSGYGVEINSYLSAVAPLFSQIASIAATATGAPASAYKSFSGLNDLTALSAVPTESAENESYWSKYFSLLDAVPTEIQSIHSSIADEYRKIGSKYSHSPGGTPTPTASATKSASTAAASTVAAGGAEKLGMGLSAAGAVAFGAVAALL